VIWVAATWVDSFSGEGLHSWITVAAVVMVVVGVLILDPSILSVSNFVA
jgi:hypothetical protein